MGMKRHSFSRLSTNRVTSQIERGSRCFPLVPKWLNFSTFPKTTSSKGSKKSSELGVGLTRTSNLPELSGQIVDTLRISKGALNLGSESRFETKSSTFSREDNHSSMGSDRHLSPSSVASVESSEPIVMSFSTYFRRNSSGEIENTYDFKNRRLEVSNRKDIEKSISGSSYLDIGTESAHFSTSNNCIDSVKEARDERRMMHLKHISNLQGHRVSF